MPIIDSQVHAYEANTPQRPWHSVPNWPPHVTGDEMAAAMDRVGVDGAIFISAFRSREGIRLVARSATCMNGGQGDEPRSLTVGSECL
jgi:predicted TIM-barrel fold metal-dependent hydrolase